MIITRRFFKCCCGKLHSCSTLGLISWRNKKCPQCGRDLIKELLGDTIV